MNVERVREEVERSLEETKKPRGEPKRVGSDFARTIVDVMVENVEAEMICKGFERSVQEMERLRKELDRVRSEGVVIEAEIERLRVEENGAVFGAITELHTKDPEATADMERLYDDLFRVEVSIGRLEKENDRVYWLTKSVCKNLETSVQETERLRAEVNRFSSETRLQRMITRALDRSILLPL